MIYVQFSDTTETKIVAVFASPQSPDFYSNPGEVALDDQRYAEYFSLLPADVQSGLPAPVNLAHEK